MIGRALTDLTGAALARRSGKRPSVKVAAAYREWARRHQDLLRRALRYPNTAVDLMDGVSPQDLVELGVITMDNGALAHPLGDDELVRLILMPRSEALAIAAERRERMRREQRGLERLVA